MALLLGFNGNDTAMAFSGPESLKRVDEFRPDAVLLDIGPTGAWGTRHTIGRACETRGIFRILRKLIFLLHLFYTFLLSPSHVAKVISPASQARRRFTFPEKGIILTENVHISHEHPLLRRQSKDLAGSHQG